MGDSCFDALCDVCGRDDVEGGLSVVFGVASGWSVRGVCERHPLTLPDDVVQLRVQQPLALRRIVYLRAAGDRPDPHVLHLAAPAVVPPDLVQLEASGHQRDEGAAELPPPARQVRKSDGCRRDRERRTVHSPAAPWSPSPATLLMTCATRTAKISGVGRCIWWITFRRLCFARAFSAASCSLYTR